MRNDELKYEEFEMLEKMASCHTYRTGKKNHDGSMGEVKLSPAGLKDILIEAYLRGKHTEANRMISAQYVYGLKQRIKELEDERDSWRDQFRTARREEQGLAERVERLTEMLSIAIVDGPNGCVEWVDCAKELLQEGESDE